MTETKVSVGPTTLKVAANIRAVRNARGMTVRRLSDKLREVGRPAVPSEVSKAETGNRGISVEMLVAYAEARGVTAQQLLEDDCAGAIRAAGIKALARAGVPTDAAPGAYDKGVRG